MEYIKSNEIIDKFLWSSLPDRTKDTYKILSTLTYPISDHDAFTKEIYNQCDPKKEDAINKSIVKGILLRMTAFDFPLINAQSALEKYHSRLGFPDLSRFFPPIQIFPAPVEHPEVDEYESYRERFKGYPDCIAAAWEAYQSALNQHIHPVKAFDIGLKAGEACM